MRNLTTLLLVLSLSAWAAPVAQDKADPADEVRAVVEGSYINGAFNALDPDAMRRGFHPDFAIFSADGEKIKRYPIDEWVAGVAKRKASPEFDPAKNVWKHKLPIIEVTGGAASVKVELYRNGTLVYTDYLSLLRFDSGWRIVAKVYHKHQH
jgi:hypothetical protein